MMQFLDAHVVALSAVATGVCLMAIGWGLTLVSRARP